MNDVNINHCMKIRIKSCHSFCNYVKHKYVWLRTKTLLYGHVVSILTGENSVKKGIYLYYWKYTLIVFNMLSLRTSEIKAGILKFHFHKQTNVGMMTCLRWQSCLPPSLRVWVLFPKSTWWQERTNSYNCPLTFTLVLACNSSLIYK